MTTELLDLPLPLLARIVALVSKGWQCFYPVFPFQVKADYCPQRELAPLRQTCRRLREAYFLALGGVCSSILTRDDSSSQRGKGTAISVSLTLSLPCLTELSVASYPRCERAIVEIVQQAENLKALKCDTLDCTGASWCNIQRLPSEHTLKLLEFGSLDEKEYSHIFSFSFECLKSLNFYSTEFVPAIPWRILRKLETFSAKESTRYPASDERLLSDLARAPSLWHLSLPSTMGTDLKKISGRHSFKSLTTLSLVRSIDEPSDGFTLLADFEPIAEAVTRGCFPSLRELIVDSRRTYIFRISVLQPILKACQATLKMLDLRKTMSITPEDVEMLNGTCLQEGFELKVSMTPPSFCLDYNYPATLLMKLINLTCISVERVNIKDLHRLAELPKLRAAHFKYCVVRAEEKEKLLKEFGRLKCIEFRACWVEDPGNTTNKRFNFYWNPWSDDWDSQN